MKTGSLHDRSCLKPSEFAWSAPGRGLLSLPSVTQALLKPPHPKAEWARWLQREAATPPGLALPSRAGPKGFQCPLFPVVPSVPRWREHSRVYFSGLPSDLLLSASL